MGWNYRKRIKILPGVTINLSKNGVSTTIGPRGANINIGKNGAYMNTGIPGTGMYRRDKIGGGSNTPSQSAPPNNSTQNSKYDNSGCFIFLACLLISCAVTYLITKSVSLPYYYIAFAVAILAWLLYIVLKSDSPSNNSTTVVTDDSAPQPTPAPVKSKYSQFLSWKKENFELMQDEADALYDFLKSATRSTKIRKELDRMMALTNSDGSPWPMKEKITLTMLLDVYRCYTSLGYEIDNKQDEELGLMLFANKISEPTFHLDYFQLIQYRDQVVPTLRGLFDTVITVSEACPIPDGQYFFQHVFENVDKERMSQYMVLLYRFASAIAKSDGTITEKESMVLANLMKAKDLTTDGKPLDEAEENSKGEQTERKSKQKVHEQDDEVSPMDELNQLIGLDSVKEEVEKLSNFIKIMKVREEQGLPVTPVSYHCVFTGNPGTGKTTVARILAGIYKELGVLEKGQLIETDRSGLVAEYVGQTAVKTNKIIDSALDGVLFIDEAYSLVGGGKEDYGQEAISTLLKRMEDDRKRLVVILAGYGNEMKTFIDSNPGLQSRFNRYIDFPDYNADDLFAIYKKSLDKHKYVMDLDAEMAMRTRLRDAVEHKDQNFGNARFVRNLFEKTLENQATRLASIGSLTSEMLCTIKLEDVEQL